jgi:RIO kinase 1
MVESLAPLLADGVIDEVVARLKSGKEADLWLVRHGGEIVAAKVYKAREQRSFRNNAVYKEGRRVRNTRTQRAIDRGTRFGHAAAEEAWKAREADALHALHAAGVRVPRPVMFYEGVLLMEVVVDAAGHPAPRLVDAHVPRAHAAALYADLRGQMVGMLRCELIHGDLSPYNVLLGRAGPVVIDFPQVIGAAHNSQAEAFFLRDFENLRRFFHALDPALHASAGDGREIWRAYVRRELTPDFVPSGRVTPPPPTPAVNRGPQHGPTHAVNRAAPHGPTHAANRAAQHGPGTGHARAPQRHGTGDAPQRHGAGDAPQRHGAGDAAQRHGAGDAAQRHGAGDAAQRHGAGDAGRNVKPGGAARPGGRPHRRRRRRRGPR